MNSRNPTSSVVIVAAAVVAALGAATVVRAAPSGQLCPSFKRGGLTYGWETAGTGWTCKSAKPWVIKLSNDRVRSGGGNMALRNGPVGYHCFASLTHKGRASGGVCYKGTLAYPISGFTWNGS